MMRRDIPLPKISSNFTVEDIHKIREWNYECQKDMTLAERVSDTAQRGEEALKRMGLAADKEAVA